MICSLMDLRNKEVVNVTNGEKLGFVDDIEINTETASVIALIIYGKERFLGFFGRDEDLIISCNQIQLIGRDTILVEYDEETLAESYKKSTKNKSFSLSNLYK